MDVAKIGMIAVVGVILAVELKEHKSSVAMYLSMAVVLLIAMLLLGKLEVIVTMFRQVERLLPIPGTYLNLLFKIIGITYVADLTAGICKDAGHGSVAQQIQMFGKVSVFAVGMPLMVTLIETIVQLV